jgi:hypothetical protein
MWVNRNEWGVSSWLKQWIMFSNFDLEGSRIQCVGWNGLKGNGKHQNVNIKYYSTTVVQEKVTFKTEVTFLLVSCMPQKYCTIVERGIFCYSTPLTTKCNEFSSDRKQTFNNSNSKVHQWTLSWASLIQFTSQQLTSRRAILIQFFHCLFDLPSSLFLRGFSTVTLESFCFPWHHFNLLYLPILITQVSHLI